LLWGLRIGDKANDWALWSEIQANTGLSSPSKLRFSFFSSLKYKKGGPIEERIKIRPIYCHWQRRQ